MSPVVQLLLTGLVGLVLPLLVRLASGSMSGAGKAVLLALLTAVSGFLNQALANPHLDLVVAALYWLEGWIVAVGTYFGLWRPVAVTLAASRARAAVPRRRNLDL